jgi:hypothetical protein
MYVTIQLKWGHLHWKHTLDPLKKHFWNGWWHNMQFFWKISQGQCVHLGFRITPKTNITSSEPLEEHAWQIWWLKLSIYIVSENKVKNASANQRLGWPCWIFLWKTTLLLEDIEEDFWQVCWLQMQY